MRFLRRLSRNLRVLVFDKRGIGMSDRVAGTPDIGVLADDVRAVMDAAGDGEGCASRLGRAGSRARGLLRRHASGAHAVLGRTATFAPLQAGARLPLGESQRMSTRPISPRFSGSGAARRRRGSSSATAILKRRRGHPCAVQRAGLHRLEREAGTLRCYPCELRGLRPHVDRDGHQAASGLDLDAHGRPLHSLDRQDEELARFEAGLIPVAQLIGVATPPAVIWVNEPEAIVSAIERFVASVRHEDADLDRNAGDGAVHGRRRLH